MAKFHVFSLLQIYYTGVTCDEALVPHICEECGEAELGGIRAVARINSAFEFTDPTSAAEWTAGIEAGFIDIYPATRGDFDGGTPVEGPGYGDAATKVNGYDFVLNFKDPDLIPNWEHYNTLKNTRSSKLAYVTETQVWLADKSGTFAPKAPVTENVAEEVVWNVQVKWTSKNLPRNYTKPEGIFVCFATQE